MHGKCCECCCMHRLIKQLAGRDGRDGRDGLTPRIGENGNWWIGDTDTGVPASGGTPQSRPLGYQMQSRNRAGGAIGFFDTVTHTDGSNRVGYNDTTGTFTLLEDGLYHIDFQIAFEYDYVDGENPTVAVEINGFNVSRISHPTVNSPTRGQMSGSAVLDTQLWNGVPVTVRINPIGQAGLRYADVPAQANISIIKVT